MKLNLWQTDGMIREKEVAVARQSGRTFAMAKRPGVAAGPDVGKAGTLKLRRLFLDNGIVFRLRLGTATRTFGKRRLDFLDRLGLRDALHRGDFA
jgi:hypothetical protein